MMSTWVLHYVCKRNINQINSTLNEIHMYKGLSVVLLRY